jgi:uncharacterized iron-regulated membrane protein
MRKILFWVHLVMGVAAGLIIFVMCVTGVLLTFERQMTDWADRHNARVDPLSGVARLPVSQLIAKAGAPVAGVIVRSDPAEPVEVVAGRDRTSVYLNPYTGAVTGSPNKAVHTFFNTTRAWHRWVALGGELTRKNTEPIFDAANVLFFLIVLSGPFLWWPKKLTWKHFRPIVWFRGKLSGKARDFNWHNTIGVWASVPLAIIVATGVILSYRWANDMVYHMTGNQPLQPTRVEPMPKSQAPPPWQGVDSWIARAETHVPDWRTVTIRSTPARIIGVQIESGTGGQPQLRGTVTFDRVTGDEVKWAPFSSNNLGLRLRMLARVFHTGEVGGMPAQAFAGLISLCGALLVYTGIALSLRRFAAWRRRKGRSAISEVEQVA